MLLRGGVIARLDPAKVTPEELGSYMTGAHDGGPSERASDGVEAPR